MASGVLYGISFPPPAWRPLAWVALVPWLVALRGGSLWRAAWLGALWAHVETYVTSDCLPAAIVHYWRQSVWVGWGVLEAATVVTMVPWYASFAIGYTALARRYRTALPLLAACAWVGAELARVKVLGGNPWAISGYSQVGVLPIMQVADVAGVHGISFLLAAVNAAIASAWIEIARARQTRAFGPLLAPLIAPVLLVALGLGYGAVRLGNGLGGASRMAAAADAEAGEDGSRETTIAIVQGNADIESQWRSDLYGKNLDRYFEMTREIARRTRPALVFWPESAMTFFLPEEPAYRRSIGRLLSHLDVQLVAGGPRYESTDQRSDPDYFNATFLVSPQGEILDWQDKRKLLPFAEYFPLQTEGLLRREFGRARQFAPGAERPPLPSVAGRLGVVVCNEAMYPEGARDAVAQGAEILVNPANDSWFGSPKYSLQAFDIVRLRAVEQRRYLVRTSTAGPSAIIDPLGRVVEQSKLFEQESIAGTVRTAQGITLYHRIGDAIPFALGLAALAALLRRPAA